MLPAPRPNIGMQTRIDGRPRPRALVDGCTPFRHDIEARRLVAENPDGMTLEEVGAGFTREPARQIEARAVRKLEKRCLLVGLTPEHVAEILAQRRGG